MAMTAVEAIAHATRRAAALNWPWDAAHAVATRRRCWPFPDRWVVVSRAEGAVAVATMRVHERRSGRVIVAPVRVLYAAGGPATS